MNYKNFIQEHVDAMKEDLEGTGTTLEQIKEDPNCYIADYLDGQYLYKEQFETLKKQYQELRRPVDWDEERRRILTQIWDDMINAILKNQHKGGARPLPRPGVN